MLKYRRVGLLVAVVSGGLVFGLAHSGHAEARLSPYFQYTAEEIASLRSLPTQSEMSFRELDKWDDILFDLMAAHNLGADEASKIFAYLAVAQRDAGALSLQLRGKLAGSLAPVSAAVLCEFFPDDCARISKRVEADPYSQALADRVVDKVKARINEDKRGTKPSQLKTGDPYWTPAGPPEGIEVASWKPWYLRAADQFRAPPPPALDYSSAEWQGQLRATQQALTHLTDEQRPKVIQYAGGPGTRTWLGVWIDQSSALFRKSKTPSTGPCSFVRCWGRPLRMRRSPCLTPSTRIAPSGRFRSTPRS